MKVINNLPQLNNLIEFEQSIKDEVIDPSTLVRVRLNNKQSIAIYAKGKTFVTSLSRGIIHQLSSRIFQGTGSSWEKADELWKASYRISPSDLATKIELAFTKQVLTIRYFEKNGFNEIYGIVTEHFKTINQLKMRDAMVNEMSQYGFLKRESKLLVDHYGRLLETFDVTLNDEDVKMGMTLVHARNNGYSAVKIIWLREIVVCKNGLTRKISKMDKMIHNDATDMNTFASYTINEAIKEQKQVLANISASSQRIVREDDLNIFLNKLVLAHASKDRIRDRFSIESKIHDRSEWALSQTLTWLGTHEKALSRMPKILLTDIGTSILDESFSKVVENPLTRFYEKDPMRIFFERQHELLLSKNKRF